MICLNCGKAIDDDLKVCPFCGSLTEPAVELEDGAPAEPVDYNDGAPDPDDGQETFDENPVYPEPRKRDAKPARGGVPFAVTPALLLSVLSCVLSLVCLLMLSSMRSSLREQGNVLTGSVSEVRNAVNAVNERLGELDTTLSSVQSEAYNQYASQAIAITKDITPLTGPVDADKYNVMFIVSAKGNLNVDTSFDWQKYNEATGGWVSLVFTGDNTRSAEYGLRLYNGEKAGVFTSELWADGITTAATGTYRCVITDATGITRTSAEATVQVS